MKLYLILSAIFGFLSVAMGAFGAHGLRDKIESRMLDNWNTGAQYMVYHSLALLAVALLLRWFPESGLLRWSGNLFALGILVFSGSLYAMTLTNMRTLGAVTPIGGLALLAGWLLLLVFAVREV